MNLELLNRPFSSQQIKKRKSSTGFTLEYIETHTVITRLNEVFAGQWGFKILDHKFLDDDVVVLGELTAEGIVKQQFGSCELSQEAEDGMVLSMGDALKSAASDALKKAATLFGVGLHLYGANLSTPDHLPDRPVEPIPSLLSPPDEAYRYAENTPEPLAVSESDIDALLGDTAPPESLITDLQFAEILDLARKRKFSKDQVEQRAQSRYGRGLKDLSQFEADEILEKLKGR